MAGRNKRLARAAILELARMYWEPAYTASTGPIRVIHPSDPEKRHRAALAWASIVTDDVESDPSSTP